MTFEINHIIRNQGTLHHHLYGDKAPHTSLTQMVLSYVTLVYLTQRPLLNLGFFLAYVRVITNINSFVFMVSYGQSGKISEHGWKSL